MTSTLVQTANSESRDTAAASRVSSAPAQDAMSCTPLQLAFLEIWPEIDVLPFDHSDPADVDRAVRANETGDTLFNFVWLELGDMRGDDLQAALDAIRRGAEDLSLIADAMERRFAPGSSPSF